MTNFLNIALGLVVGAFMWQAYRLTPKLALWLCAPFGEPGSVALMVAGCLSVLFITVGIALVMRTIIYWTAEQEDQIWNGVISKRVTEQVLVSSLFGPVVLAVVMKFEKKKGSKTRKTGSLHE